MKKFIGVLIIALCCLIQNTQAQFQDGLDHTFGNKGIVSTSSATTTAWTIFDAALQPDGKIVATAGGDVVIRYNTNGSIDKSFGKAGIFKDTIRDDNDTPLVWFYSYALGNISLQSDGKIILSGAANASYPERSVLLLARLLPNGTLDSTFGKNGVVCNNAFGSLYGGATILQPDDKIIVYASISGSPDTQVIVRYLPNGTIDSSFGTYGKVVNKSAPVGSASDIALMLDGRIVAMYDYFGVARYMPDGSLDTSFNHTGMAAMFSGISSPYPQAIAVRPDGKIWIAGHDGFSATAASFILARFNADGSPDTGFDPNAYKEYAWDTGDQNKCRAMLLQPDGKIVLGGRVMNKVSAMYNFALLRILPDGRADSSFGDYGRLLTQPYESYTLGADLHKLLLQPDNKISGLGQSANTVDLGALATIARYNVDGKTTAIREISNAGGTIKVYPNPAHSLLYIRNTTSSKISSINIANLQGLTLQTIYSPKSNTIDIGSLPSACYIITLNADDNQSYHQTIFVTH